MHRLEDLKAIFENPSLSYWENMSLWQTVDKQYRDTRSAAKKVINSANQARQNAQKAFAATDREVMKLINSNKQFKWATKK